MVMFRKRISVLSSKVEDFKENVGHPTWRLLYVTSGNVKETELRKSDYLFSSSSSRDARPETMPRFAESTFSLARHSSVTACPLKMDQMRCPETSVNIYYQTLRNIPKQER
jgi:hypothetical protein